MGTGETHTRQLTEDEFGRIFTKCRPLFIRVANSYIHDGAVAEDIVDDSFIKMWEKREEIETENYEAYAFKAVVNRCLDHLKIQQARLRIQQDIHATGNRMQMYEINSLKSLNPDRLFADEVTVLVRECLDRMPELTRKIFLESRLNGSTYSEIAVKLNTPPDRSLPISRQHSRHCALRLRTISRCTSSSPASTGTACTELQCFICSWPYHRFTRIRDSYTIPAPPFRKPKVYTLKLSRTVATTFRKSGRHV